MVAMSAEQIFSSISKGGLILRMFQILLQGGRGADGSRRYGIDEQKRAEEEFETYAELVRL